MSAKGHYCHLFNRCRFHSLDSSTTFEKVFMTDRSPLDDSLVTFDQHPSSSSSVTTPTKSKANDLYDNRSMDDVDPFASHHHGNGNGNGTNGQDYHSNNGTNKDDHHHGSNGSNDGGSKQFSLNNEHENGNSISDKSASRQILIVLFFSFARSSASS